MNDLHATIAAGFGRPPSERVSPGGHCGISSPSRGPLGAPTARRPGSGRSPTAIARRAAACLAGAAATAPRPSRRSSGAGPLRQPRLQRLVEPGFRLCARPASMLFRRGVPLSVGAWCPGCCLTRGCRRTGARGAGLTRRGRAPILVEDGAAAWFRVAPAAEPQSLGNIPPEPIEGNDPSRGDHHRGRSADIRASAARAPSRHQLTGPGSLRCPSGPAAGLRPVADGRRHAVVSASSGAAATAPRPGRHPVAPGRPRQHGR